MFNIGTGEWLIILAVLVVLFGPKRIPEALHGLGRGIRSFKKGLAGDEESPKIEPPKSSSGDIQR